MMSSMMAMMKNMMGIPMMEIGAPMMMQTNNQTNTIEDPVIANEDNMDDNNETMHVSIVSYADSRSRNAYQPGAVIVETGQSVIWINNDFDIHTVTEGNFFPGISTTISTAGFDSGLIYPGGSFTYLFDEVGTYSYQCILHPWMIGQVIVADE
jgi:plastocyanin